jgi:hypothetical protein
MIYYYFKTKKIHPTHLFKKYKNLNKKIEFIKLISKWKFNFTLLYLLYNFIIDIRKKLNNPI